MKISRLIRRLTQLEKEHGNIDIIYAADDEGNNYSEVHYDASPVWYLETDAVSLDSEFKVDGMKKVVCIN